MKIVATHLPMVWFVFQARAHSVWGNCLRGPDSPHHICEHEEHHHLRVAEKEGGGSASATTAVKDDLLPPAITARVASDAKAFPEKNIKRMMEEAEAESYTTNADFDLGSLNIANHSAVEDQLQLSPTQVVTGIELTAVPAWIQLGGDINGEAARDNSGCSVSLSSDGTVLAVGAFLNDGMSGNLNDDRGHVRVYKYIDNSWTQLGADIDGEAAGDWSGDSVSLSSDGTVLAVGAKFNDGNSGINSGHVRVYKYINKSWTQLGADIDGEARYDESGTSVSLSSDGTVIAVGAINNSGNRGFASGHVRVYKYINKSWTQLGADIDGEALYDQSGMSVSLSSDGTVLAVGARWNDGRSGNLNDDRGHVRVYKYINKSWAQLGADIDGEAAGDWSGDSVSLSSDGTVLAVGAPFNDGNSAGIDKGQVRVYKYINNSWTQLGADIDGEAADDHSGTSVSLSSDGTVIAVGGLLNDGNSGIDSGHVRVYKYINNSWTQLGADIDGEARYDYSGDSVSLSSDGTVIAVGGLLNDGGGHVRIFQFGTASPTTPTPTTPIPTFTHPPTTPMPTPPLGGKAELWVGHQQLQSHLDNFDQAKIWVISSNPNHHSSLPAGTWKPVPKNMRGLDSFMGDKKFAKFYSIGAGEDSTNLVAGINRPVDVSKALHVPVFVMEIDDPAAFKEQVDKANKKMNDNFSNTILRYQVYPWMDWYTRGYGWVEFNANGYISGLLSYLDHAIGIPSVNVYGWDKPVPNAFFDKDFRTDKEVKDAIFKPPVDGEAEIWFGYHSVFTSGEADVWVDHAKLWVISSNPAHHVAITVPWNDLRQDRIPIGYKGDKNFAKFFTLGAGFSAPELKPEVNYPDDVNINLSGAQMVTSGIDPASFMAKINTANENMWDCFEVSELKRETAFPRDWNDWAWGWNEFNGNGYISGLLSFLDYSVEIIEGAILPGWKKAVPKGIFESSCSSNLEAQLLIFNEHPAPNCNEYSDLVAELEAAQVLVGNESETSQVPMLDLPALPIKTEQSAFTSDPLF